MKSLFYWALCLLLFAACGKDSDVEKDGPQEKPGGQETTLEVSATDLVFEAAGGVKTFAVTCNGEWKLEGAGGWCTVDADAGNGNRTVSVTAAAYDGMEDRNVNLTVKAGTRVKTVGVTQKHKGAIVLSKDKHDVPQEGGTLEVEARNDVECEVRIPDACSSWITLEPDSKAVGIKTFRFRIEANDTPESRRGYIVFAGSAVKDTIYVYQSQKDCLLLERDRVDVAQEGGVFTVELKTNVDYDVLLPDDADWVSHVETRALRTDRLTFRIALNGDTPRSATVCVNDRNGNLSDTLYITQCGKSILLVDNAIIDVPAAGGPVAVEVQSNVDYEVKIQPSAFWIIQAPASKALTTKVFHFTITQNYFTDAREGYIVFASTSSKDTDTVYIRQAAEEYLRLKQDRYNVRASGMDLTVELETNADYSVEIPEDAATWVSRLETKALRTECMQFHIEANSKNVRRSTKITLKVNEQLTDTLYLTQNANGVEGDDRDITADIDAEFAKVLQEKRYIPDASQILWADVRYIEKLEVNGNFTQSLSSLKGIEYFESLTYLNCSNNQLSSLDVSQNMALTDLSCGNNQLSSLSINQNTALTSLSCANNQLTLLDVSQNTALTSLFCANNQLSSLNISQNTALGYLSCDSNQLISLDVNNNEALKWLECSGNPGQNGIFWVKVWPEENDRLLVWYTEWVYEGQSVVLKKHGKNFTENVSGVELAMVYVKGGTFRMGATGEQGEDAYGGEKPVHRVTLSDYYIGKYEVTQGLWKAVMGENPSYFAYGDNYPVESVNWNDAQEFVAKLNELTGKTYALPTEAQWEYAARGGADCKGYKFSGSNDIDEVAWYMYNSNGSTHAVGEKKPNELGIYDMSGNVWEWCRDWYGDYSDKPQVDPVGPEVGSYRVGRGGGWDDVARNCRVSYRNGISPGYRTYNLGFRLVLVP